MIEKIKASIANQVNGKIDSDNIYIVDYKNINGGGVEILDKMPTVPCVHLTNNAKVEVYYVAFGESALRIDGPEGQVKQCECVLFPTTLNDIDWVLFIETKYTVDFKTAMNEEIGYPNIMIEQIISSVKYFRDKRILPTDKKVYAIVSFPPLIEAFSEAFFTRSKFTYEVLAIDYKILLRPTNDGIIKSPKRLKL